MILAIGAVLIVGFISYYGLKSLMATIEENLEPDSREADLESLLYQVSEAESNLRIYAITEESRYLRPYFENVEKANSLVVLLRKKSKNELPLSLHIDSIDQFIKIKTGIQNRLIRLKQDQEKIDVYEEVLKQFKYLEKKNAMIDSLRNAIERAERTIESEILAKEKDIQEQGSDSDLLADEEDQERKGFFRRLFRSGKKPEQEAPAHQPKNDSILAQLDNLKATKDTLNQIIDTLESENIATEIEHTLAEISVRQENINRELALIEFNLTKRDKAYGFQIQRQAAQIHKIFAELDAAQAREASNFFHSITNQITMTGSIFAMLFIILVFIVMNDIKTNQRYRKALETAKNNAEKLAHAKEDFLSNMSHEIRTPLNAILGFAEQMNSSDLDVRNRSHLEIIQNASKHLLSITNDILDYAKIEAGKVQLAEVPFSIEENAKIVYDTLHKSAVDKNLEFRLISGNTINDIFTLGDPVRFRQILFNLAGNAIKFTEKGFVKIYLELEDDVIVLKVHDSGIGINKDHLDVIFNKFDQIPSSGSNKLGGTGLGLTIVKKLVELQNGSIEVNSALSDGTEFIVKLPFIPPGVEQQEIPGNINGFDPSFPENISVLIVDDEEYNLKLLETILDKYDIPHQSAKSGRDALELFEKNRFNYVMMDLRMDDLDGLETTKILRERYGTDIPIIATTATATGNIREKCLNAGMNEVLIKPIAEDDLLRCVQRTLQQKNDAFNKDQDINVSGVKSDPADEGTLDMNRLYNLFQNDKAVALNMARIYLVSIDSVVSSLSDGIENPDAETIRKNVHKIIPSSRHMGFTHFVDQLKALEQNLNSETATRQGLSKQLEQTISEAKKIKRVLEKFLEEEK